MTDMDAGACVVRSILREAVITTLSNKVALSSNIITIGSGPSTSIPFVTNPKNETEMRTGKALSVSNENLPSISETVPLSEPIIIMDAPLSGTFSLSVIFPVRMVCAEREKYAKKNINTQNDIFFILLNGLAI